MIEKDDIAIIKKEAGALFRYLGVSCTLAVVVKEEERAIQVSAQVDDPKLLIGEKGQTLFDIQHMLKLLARKKLPHIAAFYVSLDVNDYKKNKEEYLEDLAVTTADEVALLKKPKELPAMPPAERRIIHAALTARNDVVSESAGEEPDRHIVIKVKE